jgi:hypothetical protein
MASLAALLAVAALALVVLRPLRHEVAALERRAMAAVEARGAQAVTVTAPVPTGLEPQVARLLPEEAAPTRVLERLFALAAQHGLQLRRGDYKVGQLRPIGVDSVQVTLPLQGDYAQLRGWIAAVLAEIPQASIERLALRRDDPVQRRLEADVVITLWRKSPDGRAAASISGAAAQVTTAEARP